MVDRILIPFPAITMTTTGYSSSMQITGQCQRSTIQIRYQIQCSEGFFGPRCDCSPQPGRFTCNSNGTKRCEGTFNGSECTDCIEDYFGQNCDRQCTPQPGKYTCNPDGTINCLGNFTGNLCTICIPNHYGDHCSVYCFPQPGRFTCNSNGTIRCEGKFTGSECTNCTEGYFGQNCNCSAQPDRYTCNPDGTINCLGNFSGSLCSTCIPNHYGGDCSVYCFYPESSAHSCDIYGNKVCKNFVLPSCSKLN